MDRNERFYSDGSEYLNSLRKRGRTDYAFEDEFYYIMLGISGRI